MVFEMKLIMDEIFGSSNYRNLIVRKKCNPKNYTRKAMETSQILFFFTPRLTTTCGTVPLKCSLTKAPKNIITLNLAPGEDT